MRYCLDQVNILATGIRPIGQQVLDPWVAAIGPQAALMVDPVIGMLGLLATRIRGGARPST